MPTNEPKAIENKEDGKGPTQQNSGKETGLLAQTTDYKRDKPKKTNPIGLKRAKSTRYRLAGGSKV